MRTPAGKECRFFYGDYHRGKSDEECRLLKSTAYNWTSQLCIKCPLPDISIANECEHMEFEPRLEKPMFFMKSQVQVDVYCNKCECSVGEPRIGCGQCHPLPDIFVVGPSDHNSPA